MLQFFRVERNAALLLLASAVLGLIVANSPLSSGFATIRDAKMGLAAIHLDLTVANWLGEFFITGFFVLIGLELKCEFTTGAFGSPSSTT